MSKLLFVVHRYGFPGGSEYNVQRLAEESLRQGHDVTVLSETHTGNLNGVTVTSNLIIAFEPWDMIFVHGSCSTQDWIHANGDRVGGPIYYLLVEPPKNNIASTVGIKHATWIGWGTSFDLKYIQSVGAEEKAHQFFYGIELQQGNEGFKKRYGIENRMYLSVGGFWPHKRMQQLRDAFIEANPSNTTLVLMGYDNRYGVMPQQSSNIIVIYGADQQEVRDAMWESNLYILNSESEGYGLVLLEAMWNLCPWISTDVAAGHDLGQLGLGTVYHSYDELVSLLRKHATPDDQLELLTNGENRVSLFHNIEYSVTNLLSVLK